MFRLLALRAGAPDHAKADLRRENDPLLAFSAQSTLSHKNGDQVNSGLISELTTAHFTLNVLASGGNILILGLFFCLEELLTPFKSQLRVLLRISRRIWINFSFECEFLHMEKMRVKMSVRLQKTISQMKGRLLASCFNTQRASFTTRTQVATPTGASPRWPCGKSCVFV